MGLIDWIFGPERVVAQGRVGLLIRDGILVQQLPPGRHRLRHRDEIVILPIIPQLLLVPGQEVLSNDGFQLRLTAAVTLQVTDPARAWTANASGYVEALRLEVQLALRAIAASRSAEALSTATRDSLDAEIGAELAGAAAALGVAIVNARLRDVLLPAELRRMLTATVRAKREGMAALERARAEQASLRALANAARLLRNNPELAQLRLLQSIGERTTVVLGSPGVLPVRTEADGDGTGWSTPIR